MLFFKSPAVVYALLSAVAANPTPQIAKRQITAVLRKRDPLLGEVGDLVQGATQPVSSALTGAVSGLAQDANEGGQVFSSILQAIINTLAAQVPTPPKDIPTALATLASVFGNTSAGFYDQFNSLIEAGFGPDLEQQLDALVTESFNGQNSETNVNAAQPKNTIFPKKDCSDASYTLSETALRQVIYIPSSFTYGAKPPVILVPGTGTTGYQSFAGNYIPLLQGSSFADPVWLNIPDQLLADAQVNAEYVAYAINYISSITSKQVSVISWSQGGLDTQWALKYWPSTRSSVTNFIPHSPDFHGTTLAYILCPGFPKVPCPPSVIQQEYNSNFVSALRSNGGDSAYVTTTTIFSSTDEIVEPQSPVTGASAYLNDARGVGVTNNQVQAICGGMGPAGTFSTHEGVLYNPLAYALTVDALTNGGPGQTSRINLGTVCGQVASPGLDLVDVLTTEESILIAGGSVVLYPKKQTNEPALMPYASGNPTLGTCS